MQQNMCDLCGSNHQKVIYKSIHRTEDGNVYRVTEQECLKPETVVLCLNCGLVFVPDQRDAKALLDKYADMADEMYLREEKGRRRTAREVLRKLKRFRGQGNRILDVGCCAGFFLDEARMQGWEVHGVELSRWAVRYAKENLNLDIHAGTIDTITSQQSYFDVIVLEDTIEHLLQPKETLIQLRKILKPNGILYINTPDIDSLASRLLRAKWWGINRYHLFYFSQKTMAKLLEAAGFQSVRWSSYARSFTMDYWLYRLERYHTALYSLVKFFVRATRLDKILIRINFGDQIEVCARKRRALEYLDEMEQNAPSVSLKKLKTVVVLPAYNAAKTLQATYDDIPKDIVDEIILVDDASGDNTVELAKKLGMKVFVHEKNKGYGANQKTCYEKALEMGADIVVMVHPDYQYDPRVVPDLIRPIKNGQADAVFGSRMLKGGTLVGGMPLWKHNVNILLTAVANIILKTYLTEYHSGFRAYSARFLRLIRFRDNHDGFLFDFEIIVQAICRYCRIEEVPIRTRYFDEASTIKLWPSILYGLGILRTLFKYLLHSNFILRFRQFE